MAVYSLQGLVNKSSAEVYVLTNPWDLEQLRWSGKPYTELGQTGGPDGALKALFKKYQGLVRKLFVYDPAKDWTWRMALMMAAQQNGLAVTESIRAELASTFRWSGEVEDLRDRWGDKIQAYDWAISYLMPNCTRKVLFSPRYGKALADYAVATGGFVFWLDPDVPTEHLEMERIFRAGQYTVGTSLLGYGEGGDKANKVANPFGIGYVVGADYANGSFWSSFPDKTYSQLSGRAVAAQPGKVYVTIFWSDGDNLRFDQDILYRLWSDSARGKLPVGTELSPTLQELNTPLLNWYYTNRTSNDELMSGPSGVQFIYGNDFNDQLFPAWCALNRTWLADAGFHTVNIYHMKYPSPKYNLYIKICGLDGVFNFINRVGFRHNAGFPVIDNGVGVLTEQDLYDRLVNLSPGRSEPVFVALRCSAAKFHNAGNGYGQIVQQVERAETAYPGRFVFLLPKDLCATIRNYFHLP